MNQLTVIERENQRVMTTSVLAEEYGTTEKVISNNFNNNKIRYAEGKHFYCLEGDELKRFKSESEILGIAPNLNKLYLWTEKGALLHAKSLGTDKAWEVYDFLVENYFMKNTPKSQAEILLGQAQMLVDMEHKQHQQQKAIEDTNKRIDGIKEIVALNPNDWRKDTAKLLNKMALLAGGYEHLRNIREESYRLLDERYGVSLSIRLTNKKKTMALNGVCKSKVDKLNKLDAIADDKKLIEGYIAIIKEMCIRYGVEANAN